ncbi:ATP-binding protein [Actinacidiphila sp. ITFR-21]|uniref:ATP-binding protein n=1 Tax=Actinacidiphila sp. ITFR-21 TaxID=3075199 RepID=UPI00288B36AE|nr:ATP-binding protein [Streptomyces sp. ITFR-21]WNI17309.1 ATP-binding protein [Streptomyces sp. ITFR-21]
MSAVERPGVPVCVVFAEVVGVLPASELSVVGDRGGCVLMAREARSVRRARGFVVRVLDGWGLADLADDAGLVVSELVTNAVMYAVPPAYAGVRVRVVRLAGGVRVEVHDASAAKPERHAYGRGLVVVDALTGGNWGVDTLRFGKSVWAELGGDTARARRQPPRGYGKAA